MTLTRRDGQQLATREAPMEWPRLGDEVTRALERAFANWGRPWSWMPDMFTPLGDIEETDDSYIVEVELPGLKKDDVSVEVQGRRVVVSGERKERERTGIFRSKTRVTGRFHYEAVLPGDIEQDRVTANLADGVLRLDVPKPESERRQVRHIPIN